MVTANDGVVMVVGSLKGFGETIIIDHNSEFMTIYGSIKPESFLVKIGDYVKKDKKSLKWVRLNQPEINCILPCINKGNL
ncbi:M23 family metallopeptidase [Brevibacillus laterosporus]|uniref:M23 family metallopeptidase n=1 Tax=Brevibacillus laterosporus TaxID=1465 RepID=A0AAP3DG85_BRELA|nr:M23 family metallopeptidase [Brevibacillus laterosporus]MCR8980749.1 M23 family metallopeptidase [Brevibacillus laterosporus]MCZ0807904.1 M23 family metallopeptidase [Brevibacillus laterosporus]MCZ0826205.1 M23 family metallopeptidase [Brevibacillus laterosporus]MCZ0851216.1 M23 family metallopeptidase [Brevibacillus laterosporus]